MIGNNEIIIRLLLGAVFGGIIGFERSTHGRPAGFRTHLLVCVASVLIMIVSEYYHHLSTWDPSYVRVDPARLAAGAVTGVGFLGAGVIIKTGLNIQGLTTAACLWIVSAIGLAVGGGLYTAGIVSFVITYLALWLLRRIEDKMTRLSYKFVNIVMGDDEHEDAVTAVIRKYDAKISSVNYSKDVENREFSMDVTISLSESGVVRKILDEISSIQNVRKVSVRG